MMETQHFLFQGDTSIIDSSDFKGVSRVVSFLLSDLNTLKYQRITQ